MYDSEEEDTRLEDEEGGLEKVKGRLEENPEDKQGSAEGSKEYDPAIFEHLEVQLLLLNSSFFLKNRKRFLVHKSTE